MASVGYLILFCWCVVGFTVAVGPYDLDLQLSMEDRFLLKSWSKDVGRKMIRLRYSPELNLPQEAFDCANAESRTHTYMVVVVIEVVVVVVIVVVVAVVAPENDPTQIFA